MYLSKSKITPKNQSLLQKNILLLISYTEYTRHIRFCLHQSGPLSPSSLSVPSSSSHSLLTFPIPSLPFHSISPVSSTALDIQHFLEPFTVTSGEICCHTIMIHNDSVRHLHFLVYNYLNPRSYEIFSTDDNGCVKTFKYTCSGYLCCVWGQIHLTSLFFLWFLIYGMVQVFILEYCSQFLIFLIYIYIYIYISTTYWLPSSEPG